VDHVSVDLLVSKDSVGKAVRVLKRMGFKIIVLEPYTVTLARKSFIDSIPR
jgi:predicted Fe-Mo cluster-binding NifX family protein